MLRFMTHISKFNNNELDKFISDCDVISLHVHLNHETKLYD